MVRGVSEDRGVSSHFHSPRARHFLFSPYPFTSALRSVQPNESCPHTPSVNRDIRICDVTGELIDSQQTQFCTCPPFFLWSFQLYPVFIFRVVVPPSVPHRFYVLPRVQSSEDIPQKCISRYSRYSCKMYLKRFLCVLEIATFPSQAKHLRET